MSEDKKILDEQLDNVTGGTKEDDIRRYQQMKEYERRKMEAAEQAKREEEERLMLMYGQRKEALQNYMNSQAQ